MQIAPTISASGGRKPASDLPFSARLDLGADAAGGFGAYASFRLDTLASAAPGDSRAFRSEALWVEELFAQWTDGVTTLRAGRFVPNFARAWSLLPSVLNSVAPSEYQIVNQIGVQAGRILANGGSGLHAVTVSWTMADRTFLSQSMLTNRGQVHLSDGGPSNTDWPRSVAVACDGVRVPVAGLPVSYQAAYAYLAAGRRDTGDEHLASIGANKRVELGGGGALKPLAELGYRWNADGRGGRNIGYATAAVELDARPWSAALIWSGRDERPRGGSRFTDLVLEANAQRELGGGFRAGAAYVYDRTRGGESHTFGVVLSYALQRCDGCRTLRARQYWTDYRHTP